MRRLFQRQQAKLKRWTNATAQRPLAPFMASIAHRWACTRPSARTAATSKRQSSSPTSWKLGITRARCHHLAVSPILTAPKPPIMPADSTWVTQNIATTRTHHQLRMQRPATIEMAKSSPWLTPARFIARKILVVWRMLATARPRSSARCDSCIFQNPLDPPQWA